MNNKYNILIVDDEELALIGMIKGVHWEQLDVEKVFKAHTADTAKRIMTQYDIHILLTDIELENDTGLNLLKWTRIQNPNIICIFFTCHAEFEYAQEALRLGAKDYLLKPVPYSRLEEIIGESIKSLEQQKVLKDKFRFFDEIEKDVSDNKVNEAIATVKKYISENLANEISRDELANKVNFSSSYLSKIFKTKEGISITEYILKRRIQMAKHLLKITELPVTDIAIRTGFAYPSYFTKYFKKIVGVTPKEYRKKEQDDYFSD